MPDNNGDAQDTECANSSLGNAETYLVKDVPYFMQANFNAAVGKHSLAVAGLSAGGTCAIMLALRNPTVFPTFGDYSGYASPTYQNDDEQQTITILYGGSKANYDAHDPAALLTNKNTRAGRLVHRRSEDPGPLAAMPQFAPLAEKAGLQVCRRTHPVTTRSPSGRPSRTRCPGCPGDWA